MKGKIRTIFLTAALCSFAGADAQADPKLCPLAPPLEKGQDDLE